MEGHAAIHLIQQPASRTVFFFGLLDDCIGSLGIVGKKILVDQPVGIERTACGEKTRNNRKEETLADESGTASGIRGRPT
jgi:hypothetical protein